MDRKPCHKSVIVEPYGASIDLDTDTGKAVSYCPSFEDRNHVLGAVMEVHITRQKNHRDRTNM